MQYLADALDLDDVLNRLLAVTVDGDAMSGLYDLYDTVLRDCLKVGGGN